MTITTRRPTAAAFRFNWPLVVLAFAELGIGDAAFAHGATLGDKGYIQEVTGLQILPFPLSRRKAHGHWL